MRKIIKLLILLNFFVFPWATHAQNKTNIFVATGPTAGAWRMS
jgi:hypothetical protein